MTLYKTHLLHLDEKKTIQLIVKYFKLFTLFGLFYIMLYIHIQIEELAMSFLAAIFVWISKQEL